MQYGRKGQLTAAFYLGSFSASDVEILRPFCVILWDLLEVPAR